MLIKLGFFRDKKKDKMANVMLEGFSLLLVPMCRCRLLHDFTDNKLLSVKSCMLFFIQTLPRIIVCQRYKPCEFLGFVWIDCWGNKSNPILLSLSRRIQLNGDTVGLFNSVVTD